MKRLAKEISISLILLLISTLIVPFNSRAFAASECPVYRLSGADRFQTAVAISMEGWEISDYVIIATGEGDDKFADALAGTPLAYIFGAPVLLTTTNVLNANTRDEIVRLKARRAIILGGTDVVSSNVEEQLKDMGLGVERLWGRDRNETAIKIAEKLWTIKPFTKVYITTGYEFQYAMMIAPFAAMYNMPILFSPDSSSYSLYADKLGAWGVNEIEIIGNTDVVPEWGITGLKLWNVNITRVSGSDMGETNVNVAKKYSGGHTITAARNDLFADGLAGAAFAARKGFPIMLVGHDGTVGAPDGLDPEIYDYIKDFHAEKGYVFGGADVLPDYIIDIMRSNVPLFHEYGNTIGNLNNNGLAAVKNDTIFYMNTSQDNKLYCVNIDGTGKKKVCDDPVWFINVVGNWVYYVNRDSGIIYKIKTDGTCRTRINNDWCWYFSVVDNWMYYLGWDGKMYRIATDGTQKTCLTTHKCYFTSITDGWIYYLNADDGQRIYRMKTDGSSNRRINTVRVCYFDIQDGWIYFQNMDDHDKLYKMKTYDTFSVKLCNDSATWINITGSDIYYTNVSAAYSMYKIKTDGTNIEPVYNGVSTRINILPDAWGGWIYFSNDINNIVLDKIRTDGTGLVHVD